MTIADLFSVNTVMFTAMGYSMSYLEFVGTILNLWCVWLVMRNNIWTWPVGIAGVILFGILFYQIQLYSDLVEQVYFFATGFYGWWVWTCNRGPAKVAMPVTHMTVESMIGYAVAIVAGTVALGYFMGNIHLYFPTAFPEPASYPYLDAFTTAMSFAAQLLMAHKKTECWYLWIAVDIIGIGLYAAKGVIFVAMLYAAFLVLASRGARNWVVLSRRAQA